MMNTHGTTKRKLNFKERLYNLGFRNINDVSFWRNQLSLRKQTTKDRETFWLVEINGQILCANKSVIVCVEYLEENNESI